MKHVVDKITDIMSSGTGVFAWVVCTITGFLSGYEGMFGLLFFCVLTDASWGIYNAIKDGRFVLSDLMRATVGKILSYCSVFLVIIWIEKILHIESGICSAIIVGVIALTEVWSICGHILIRFPNLLFFRLLKPALVGEIARKLHIEEKDVEQILNEKNSNNGKKKQKQKSERL